MMYGLCRPFGVIKWNFPVLPFKTRCLNNINLNKMKNKKFKRKLIDSYLKTLLRLLMMTLRANIFEIYFHVQKQMEHIRLLLNLKQFNEDFVEKVHFKMESLQSVITAVRKNCCFSSVDIAEAFYTIPVC